LRIHFALGQAPAELNESVNQLAAVVCRLPVDSEAPVAVFFEQGIPMITAILAVLKAGRIYVALDPADSQERIDFMPKSWSRLLRD